VRERQVRAESLSHLRRRLTLWYAGTFSLILIVLGWGLFIVIRAQFSRDLAASLRENTDRVRQRLVAGQVTPGSPFASTPPAANVDSEATLYLFTADGRAIEPPQAESWIRDAALHAARAGKVDREHDAENEVTFFLHAERVDLPNGDRYVAAAVRKDVEFEDRYSALIAAFISAAVIALVLLAGGGWFLVRQSTAPVEASIEQMRRFVADAAHELRTPLTILRSRTEVALQQPREASSYQQTLRGIESDARHLGGIVEDLFTLARADAGERPRVSQRLSLDDIALDAAQAARVVAQAKGVTLDVMEFEEARADGDPALLRQLFMILLDNAVKFTEAGGRVTMRVGSDAGHATVSVEDTGIGIPAEHVPRIFDRFYRTDVARTPGQMADGGRAGAGLGLSIARWIADVHAAHMSVDSRPGVGTRMTVRFPATTSS
jgi:signal transduction histidine kinase